MRKTFRSALVGSSPPQRGNLRFFAVFFTLLFAIGLTFSLSGCEGLDELGLDIEDPEGGKKSGNGEKPDPGTEPAEEPEPPPLTKPPVIENAKDESSIKAKFAITEIGKAGVTATFNTLSDYIQMGGLEDGVIQLGDWIDLEGGLQVEAYDNGSGFTATNTHLGDKGRLLRLIVVGINSFHSGRGMIDSDTITQNGDANGQYAVKVNGNTPHVVFQFQNIPVKPRMNSTDTNAGGYAASMMRTYLTGNFLAGLTEAGVPDDVLWAPKRIVSVNNGQGVIEDLLWLPTEREMFGKNANSAAADETADNQARLEYYDSDEKRKKYLEDNNSARYWLASPSYTAVYGANSVFCAVGGGYGSTDYNEASAYHGCAPAFCVRGEKPEPGAEPATDTPSSIKDRFGITSLGKAAVTDTFNALSAYIKTAAFSSSSNMIQLGDWIDLEGGITVGAYSTGEGGFSYTSAQAVEPVTWTVTNTDFFPARTAEPRGTRCRLIVVGINSFHSGGGSGGQYTETENDGTPHVVFQFQNIPVNRRMNSSMTNGGGYRDSEMRKYLTKVEGDGNSGKFLAGLLAAGVPEGALWAPKRVVSLKGAEGSDELKDLLWLPTERELFENGKSTYQYKGTTYGPDNPQSVTADETAENQARLEYYTTNESRLKFFAGGSANITAAHADDWWEASPAAGVSSKFCFVGSDGTTYSYSASGVVGCVPAFCVR